MIGLLGYTREEFLGKELWEIGLLRDEKFSQEAFQELKEKGFIRYEDLPLKTKLGERRDVEVVANLYEEDQRPVIQCNIRDITERKNADESLRVSERRYRRLFEAAQDGILVLDPATRKITDVNPFMSEFLGYSREEFLGTELWEIGLLKDEQASREAFLELKEKGFIRYDDLPLKTKGGAQREVEFVSNRYAENGHDVIQCNIRDVTERRHSMEALRLAEDKFQVMFQNAVEGIYQSTPEGRYVTLNPAFATILGYASPEEMIRECPDIARQVYVDSGKRDEFSRLLEEVGVVVGFEHEAYRKDGSTVWVSLNARAVRDGSGKIVLYGNRSDKT